jgi:ADP-ribose pyrophosphatase
MELEEKTLKSTTVYEGKKLSLRKDIVLLPNGEQALKETVDRRDSVVILALTKDRKVIVEKQFRHPFLMPIKALPYGKRKTGKIALLQLEGKLLEETGYVAGSLALLGTFYPAPAYSTEKAYLYLGEDLAKKEQSLDKDEFIEVGEEDFSLLVEEAEANRIQDMRSVLSLLLARDALAKRR